MRLIRNILLSILLVFITSMVALWAAAYFLQPTTFKLIAKKQLYSLTHQDSAIEGNINWRIFPRPGLHLTKVRIGDVKKTDGDYALAVDNLTFYLQLMPLFQGQLIFDKIIFDGFTLCINLNEKVPPSPQKTQAPPKNKTTRATHVALKSLLLTNGKIILNQKNKQQLLLKQVRLKADFPKQNHEQFPIQLKATLQKKSNHLSLSGTLNYKGLLTLPALDTKNTQLENLELDGQTTLQNIHLNTYEITAASAHTFLRQGKLELNPLTLSLYNGESVGQLTYQLKTNHLSFSQTGTHLSAEPVFQQAFPLIPSRVTGTLDYSIQAKAQLNQTDWHKTMHASGNLTLHDGTLGSINLPALTAETTQTIQMLAAQNIEQIQHSLDHIKPWQLNHYSGHTAFQLFNFQYQTTGNELLNYHLLLETPKLNLKGQGTLNLTTEAISAHLLAHVITKDKTSRAIQKILGHGFPLRVKGTLSRPLIYPDSHVIQTNLSNHALPKSLVKPLNKLKKHIDKTLHAK